jgi:hypothetical protein
MNSELEIIRREVAMFLLRVISRHFFEERGQAKDEKPKYEAGM